MLKLFKIYTIGIYKYAKWWIMFFFLTDDQIIERVAARCRAKRQLLGMTQKELAKKSNLSLPTIKKFESSQPPSFITLIHILRALGDLERLEELIVETDESVRDLFYKERGNKK